MVTTADISLSCVLDITSPLNSLICLDEYAGGLFFGFCFFFIMVVIIGSYVSAKGPGDGLMTGGFFTSMIGIPYVILSFYLMQTYYGSTGVTMSVSLELFSIMLMILGMCIKFFETQRRS